jgi:electron transfer flavoprotein beta subunit
MNIMVCIKRVPDVGSKIRLTDDGQAIDTTTLGFTISPHEECAVEEAISIIEKIGGNATVLTLGPTDAEEQLKDSLARGMTDAILLETDQPEWDPHQTAQAIIETVNSEEAKNGIFDLLMFGSESADSGNAQIGIRVANGLDRPIICGLKDLTVTDSGIIGKRDIPNGMEIYETTLPAVATIKEGINLPRYPSLRGRIKAKKKEIIHSSSDQISQQMKMIQLQHPDEQKKEVEMLGEGASAAPEVVNIFKQLKLLK